MEQKTLIFLEPFSIKNPTLDEQNDFMIREVVTEVECAGLGKIYNNNILHDKDLAVFIPNEVKKYNPEWVVALGQSATVALSIRSQKKILFNPIVSYDHLNNVSEFDIEYTYGLFEQSHEEYYERFLSVFYNAALFPPNVNLSILIKAIIKDIING